MELIINNGKVLEPSSVKKAIAAVSRDTIAVVTLPRIHVQEMIAHKIWDESSWMRKYQSCTMHIDDKTGDFTLNFSTASVTKNK